MIVPGRDIPLVLLRPRHERKISKREYERIRASILAVGLIEPLLVFPEDDYYIILNGHQRYRILLELGVETVPCIFAPEKESFTSNRMVNRLSPLQESRMIKKSLDELDEKTIAAALGIAHIAHRLNATLLKQLHPIIAAAFDAETINKACVLELSYVMPKRQEEILRTMENYKDYSVPFARSLVLKTPQHARAKNRTGREESLGSQRAAQVGFAQEAGRCRGETRLLHHLVPPVLDQPAEAGDLRATAGDQGTHRGLPA